MINYFYIITYMQKVNIIKLENDIKQFIHRYVKEKLNGKVLNDTDKFNSIVMLRDYISLYLRNTYKVTDGILNDIISLICQKGCINLSTLINDINEHIKKNKNNEDIKLSFKTNEERITYIKNYMVKNMTSYGILSRPINNMFHWMSTKSGYNFYAKLDIELRNSELNFFGHIMDYINNCFNHYN